MGTKRRRLTTQAIGHAIASALMGDQREDGGYDLDGLHEAQESIGHSMHAGKSAVILLESLRGSGKRAFRLVVDDGDYSDGGTWDVVITRVREQPAPRFRVRETGKPCMTLAEAISECRRHVQSSYGDNAMRVGGPVADGDAITQAWQTAGGEVFTTIERVS